jgi:hypothetical protein
LVFKLCSHLFVQPLHPIGWQLDALVQLLYLTLQHVRGDEALPAAGGFFRSFMPRQKKYR